MNPQYDIKRNSETNDKSGSSFYKEITFPCHSLLHPVPQSLLTQAQGAKVSTVSKYQHHVSAFSIGFYGINIFLLTSSKPKLGNYTFSTSSLLKLKSQVLKRNYKINVSYVTLIFYFYIWNYKFLLKYLITWLHFCM